MPSLSLALIAVALAAVESAELVGRITRPIRPSQTMTAFGCEALTDGERTAPPPELQSATSACRFTLVGAGQGAPALLIAPASGPLIAYADLDRDGSFSAAERFTFSKAPDPALDRQVELRVPSGTVAFPVLLRIRSDSGALKLPLALRLIQSYQVVIQGEVEISRRPRRIEITADVKDGQVDPRNARIGFDTNGDGRIDDSTPSPELIETSNDRAVFKVADQYVAVRRIDAATGEIALQLVDASDYHLIDVGPGAGIPDFVFIDFDGNERRLSEFRGKYVLLDFWGTWCGPCVAELPDLKEAYDRFRARRFEILGLDFEHRASADTVRAFLREKGITWANATPDSVKDLVQKAHVSQ